MLFQFGRERKGKGHEDDFSQAMIWVLSSPIKVTGMIQSYFPVHIHPKYITNWQTLSNEKLCKSKSFLTKASIPRSSKFCKSISFTQLNGGGLPH